MEKKDKSIVLVDIRSAHNVGSIFRTADSVGIEHIYITGYTPAPTDRFRRVQKDISKTALGAEKSVSWSRHEDSGALIEGLRENGVECVAVEQDERSINYRNFEKTKPTAFIFGNEVDGLSKDILDKSDKIIDIPQRGKKESLNVSVAVGVVLYDVLK